YPSELGYRQTLRETFLMKQNNLAQKTNIWSLTWEINDMNSLIENRMMGIFIKQAEQLVRDKRWEILRDWLGAFLANVSHRNMYHWPTIEQMIESTLNMLHLSYIELKPGENNEYKSVYSLHLVHELLNY